MALGGIKLAIEMSQPSSFLFVFTDASAKDAHLKDDVINKLMQKEQQVLVKILFRV